MKAVPKTADWKAALKQCLASRIMATGSHYQALLSYLVEATIDGRRPKASDIAMDVFGKDPSAKDYDEAVVRVYVRNLRQKLQHYYEDEGQRDRFRLSIPKGGYGVSLEVRRWYSGIPPQLLKRVLLALMLVAALFAAFRAGQWLRPPQSVPSASRVWNGVADSDLPLLMVLGNPFIYVERDSVLGRSFWIKDFAIQNVDDFNRLKASQPHRDLKVSVWPYYTDNVIFGMVAFLPFLERYSINFTVEERTDLTLEDVERQNVLFVGGQHTLGFFKELLRQPPVAVEFADELILHSHSGRPDTRRFQPGERIDGTTFEDIAVLIKIPGPRRNVLTVVTSYHGTGTRSGARLMTDPAGLHCLEEDLVKTIGDVPHYFIAVFKVLGIGDLDYRAELLYAEAVDGSLPLWTAIPAHMP